MTEELLWAALAVLMLFGFIGAGLLRERLSARRRMRLRQMLHDERMAALDKGVALPDTDADDLLTESFASTDHPAIRGIGWSVRTLRRAVLGLGLVLLLGGLGWIIGLGSVPVTEETLGMRELASLGAIPSMVGIGLLIFWYSLGRQVG